MRNRLRLRSSSRCDCHTKQPIDVRRHSLPVFDRQQHEYEWIQPHDDKREPSNSFLHRCCQPRCRICRCSNGICGRCPSFVGEQTQYPSTLRSSRRYSSAARWTWDVSEKKFCALLTQAHNHYDTLLVGEAGQDTNSCTPMGRLLDGSSSNSYQVLWRNCIYE